MALESDVVESLYLIIWDYAKLKEEVGNCAKCYTWQSRGSKMCFPHLRRYCLLKDDYKAITGLDLNKARQKI